MILPTSIEGLIGDLRKLVQTAIKVMEKKL
jgi:hypothetical protein